MSDRPAPDPGEVDAPGGDGAPRSALVVMVVVAGVLAGIVAALLLSGAAADAPADDEVLATLEV
nr:hypothetical protein [Acidimicrobiia bacterium]